MTEPSTMNPSPATLQSRSAPHTVVRTGQRARPRSIPTLISENANQIIISCSIVVISTTVLASLGPRISQFWAYCLQVLVDALGLNAHIGGQETLAPFIALPLGQIGPLHYLIHLGSSLLVYLLCAVLPAPFRAAFRLLATLHLFFLAIRALLPDAFPYGLADHTRMLTLVNVALLAALPTVLAFTHAIIERSYGKQIFATILIATYFVISLPVKLMAHALIIHGASQLIMPLMFIVLGPAFDVFVLTALYAFAVTWRHNHSVEATKPPQSRSAAKPQTAPPPRY